jgi:2-keto-myo-inositol isomerase
LVHDTFHHALAREPDFYPALTALTHVSGVAEPSVSLAEMRDSHRGLVDAGDRLDSAGQIKALLQAGYAGPLSFEPFAPDVHTQPDPAGALRASMEYLTTQL